uniref:hypothetical protein n=1 Tax=Oceanobacillus damuensis TaxID=937928 RepID=UPI000829FC8B|nr:hypothetical protein [Oceanobacillus damuensis]
MVNLERPDYEGELVKAIYDMSQISDPVYKDELNAYIMTLRVHHVFRVPNSNLGWLWRDLDKDEFRRTALLTVLYDEEEIEWKLESKENLYFTITTSDQRVLKLN